MTMSGRSGRITGTHRSAFNPSYSRSLPVDQGHSVLLAFGSDASLSGRSSALFLAVSFLSSVYGFITGLKRKSGKLLNHGLSGLTDDTDLLSIGLYSLDYWGRLLGENKVYGDYKEDPGRFF